MTAPLYMQTQIMRRAIDRIVPGVLQERIDQVWLNILARYFPPVNEFQLEREAYVGNTAETRRRANVSISNLCENDLGEIDLHKFLVVEAKCFPGPWVPKWVRYYDWDAVLDQLEGYMLTMRTTFGNVQTMYGLVAVGDKVRFYELSREKDELTPVAFRGRITLDIKDDARLIENELMRIAALVVQEDSDQ